MPLFPRVPIPVNPDGKKEGGGGYQWIIDKFVAMASDLSVMREQATSDQDKSEYRRMGAINKELDNPAPEALPSVTLSLGVVRPGTTWELERLIVNANAAAAGLTVLVLSGPKRSMDTIIDMSPNNVATTAAKGFVREYQNKIVLREGMELIVRLLNAEVAELPIEATAFVRVFTELPAGLAQA